MKRKYIDDNGWKRVPLKQFKVVQINDDDFKGYIGLLKMDKVLKPLVYTSNKARVCIIDNDYTWLRFLQENAEYSILCVFDENDNIVQWYFDVIGGQGVNKGIPYFDDLYLDIIIYPSGHMFEKDEKELKLAYKLRKITDENYKMARRVATNIMKKYKNKDEIENLKDYTLKYLNKTRAIINSI